MKKIGISCGGVVAKYGIERGLEICKESGFDAVDYNLECYRLGDEIYGGSDDAFEEHFTAIRKKAESLGLEISQTHGRCETYLFGQAEHNAEIDAVNALDFKASALLGAPSCVVHFPNSSKWGKVSPKLMHEYSSAMFDAIVPWAEKYGVNIALETFGAARVSGREYAISLPIPSSTSVSLTGWILSIRLCALIPGILTRRSRSGCPLQRK